MWYPAAISDPSAEPITLEEACDHLRVDDEGERFIVLRLISVARAFVEDYCAARWAPRTAVLKCDAWEDMARMPEAPIQSVATITYTDTNGATQTLSTDVYELRADGLEAAIVAKYGQVFPPIRSGSRITVTVLAGPSAMPLAVKHAMLLYIGYAYENREGGKTAELDAMAALLANYRRGA